MAADARVGDVISELRQLLGPDADSPSVRIKLIELQEHVLRLIAHERETAERCAELEKQLAQGLREARHATAQPLTTIQFFLDLLPRAMEKEGIILGKLGNADFWVRHYRMANEAVQSIPKILGRCDAPSGPAPLQSTQPGRCPAGS